MRRLFFALAVAALAGCAAHPNPPVNGYVRVKSVEGCPYGDSEPSLVLGTDLEATLRELIAGRVLESPECWYEKSNGVILLAAGPLCLGYDEFTFSSENGKWELLRSRRVDFVMCHERVR